jgi:hypothetical protein
MVEFFDTVGSGENTGYGTVGVPKAHPGAKESYRKLRESKVKAESSVSVAG